MIITKIIIILNLPRTWLFEENIYEKLGLLMLDQGTFFYSKYIDFVYIFLQ